MDDAERPFQFSSALPDDSAETRRRSNAGADGRGERNTAEPDSAISTENLVPYRDCTVSASSATKPRLTFKSERSDEDSEPYSPGRQTTIDSARSGASRLNLAKTKIDDLKYTASPWQHQLSKEGSALLSSTIREFDPTWQRRRLLVNSLGHFILTALLCGALAACLIGFQSLAFMTLQQKHAFNALVVLLSLFLGNNLSASLREFAQMLRWRLMAAKYRRLREFELLMQCESLKKVLRLFWTAHTPGRSWLRLNKTQWLCLIWISINILFQVLVALLGLTYNLDSSLVMQQNYGQISICDLSLIRDVWGASNPGFYGQLGSANAYGIQGQDYNFTPMPPSAQIDVPTVYVNANWTTMQYIFQDRNIHDQSLTLVTKRTINATATCESLDVVEGGFGNSTNVTYIDGGIRINMDVARVGPGAMTYISNINSTCGPRCTQVMALQSAGSSFVKKPSFFKCNNTITPVSNAAEYVQPGQMVSLYQLADIQARIMAGAIGWSGFNFTPADQYQYVRYSLDSWWSPNEPTNVEEIANRVMEFSIEGIAAMDYNGPRRVVAGWYPVSAQMVTVQWQWAAAILGVIPFIQFVGMCCVIAWANKAVIKDTSFLGAARLLRPVVEKLGSRGCLLTGEEIAEELSSMRVMYGFREPEGSGELGVVVRHVDLLEEKEGLGRLGSMPPGMYDGPGLECRQVGSVARRIRTKAKTRLKINRRKIV